MSATGPGAELPRTDRPDAPAYLTSYQARAGAGAGPAGPPQDNGDPGVPLYLRSFRARQAGPNGAKQAGEPAWQGEDLGVTPAWAEVTRTKEIVPERREQGAKVVTDVYLVRHGETQGYSSESGLTPLGSWQSHRRGQEIARRVLTGHRVVIACAPTNRARQTAEHLRRGLVDNMVLFGRDAEVGEVAAAAEFRNFAVATPQGPRDVTAAFRLYHREMERYERIGLGERPGWLVETDRFWGIQVATHSGPIRAFATWAMGYDPGEPFNAEFVRVRLIEGGVTALVLYRNRVQEVRIPVPADLAGGTDPRFEEASA